MGHQGEPGDKSEGMGSRVYFGRYVRALRGARRESMENWHGKIGRGADKGQLSLIERGEVPLPSRDRLVTWGKKLELSAEERNDLMFAAGYLPPIDAGFTSQERSVF